ncbi:MAG: hypothetical protein K1X95_13875 [Acidimicrobiia bacterium]|nr:hypothetical protein [Acidimicrobiia bacterium]
MAAGLILQFPASVTESDYDAVNEKLPFDARSDDTTWPRGLLSHAAGPSDEGWLVFEIWESKDAQATFMENDLGPALGAVGLPDPTRVTWFDVVNERHPG